MVDDDDDDILFHIFSLDFKSVVNTFSKQKNSVIFFLVPVF